MSLDERAPLTRRILTVALGATLLALLLATASLTGASGHEARTRGETPEVRFREALPGIPPAPRVRPSRDDGVSTPGGGDAGSAEALHGSPSRSSSSGPVETGSALEDQSPRAAPVPALSFRGCVSAGSADHGPAPPPTEDLPLSLSRSRPFAPTPSARPSRSGARPPAATPRPRS